MCAHSHRQETSASQSDTFCDNNIRSEKFVSNVRIVIAQTTILNSAMSIIIQQLIITVISETDK